MLSMFVAACLQWRTSVAVVKSPSFATAADYFALGVEDPRKPTVPMQLVVVVGLLQRC